MTIPPVPEPGDAEASRQASPYGADAAPASAETPAPAAPTAVQQYAQPGYAQPGYAQPAYGAYAAPEPKGLSLTSLILGIGGLVVGWLLLGLPSVAAVIFGHLGLKREPAGRAFAITGLVTGYIGIAFGAILVLITILSFVLYGSIFAIMLGAMASDPSFSS